MNHKSIGFLNSFTLKMIAILSMLTDHIGFIFYPENFIFRAFGRLAFPIFCFLIVEGFHHTRSHLNYLVRLIVFAAISEIPFDLAFRGVLFDWQHQNVFFTLALGLISIFCLEEMNSRRIYMLPFILTWGFAYFLKCDYGVGGVIFISTLYLTREMPWIRLILSSLILYLFWGAFELFGLLAIIPITFYNGKRGASIQMPFYWFYPLHLLVLYGIKTYL